MYEVLRTKGVNSAVAWGEDRAATLLPHAQSVKKHDNFKEARDHAQHLAKKAPENVTILVRNTWHPDTLLLILTAETERRRAAALDDTYDFAADEHL